MTLTEEATYLPAMQSSKAEQECDHHWDINDNILPVVSMLKPFLSEFYYGIVQIIYQISPCYCKWG